MTFAERLILARHEKGWTRGKLVQRLKIAFGDAAISLETIKWLEYGWHQTPRTETLIQLRKVMPWANLSITIPKDTRK